MSEIADADTILTILEEMVIDLEQEHRYDVIGKRSVTHVVADGVQLKVAMQYNPRGEELAFYGNVTALRNHPRKARLAYGIQAEGRYQPFGISRDEAVELLESRELPQRWYETQLPALTPPDEADESGWSVTGFLASVRPTAVRDHGPARVGTQGAPRR